MMHRLGRDPMLILPILLGVIITLLTVRVVRADDLDPDQIKAAMHTTSDIEGGFVDRTVAMVQAGTLPRDLFTSTFFGPARSLATNSSISGRP